MRSDRRLNEPRKPKVLNAEPPDPVIALVAQLREHANTHGADAPDGFNYFRYEDNGDHWHCSACGKQSRDGHYDFCFKLALNQAADLLASLGRETRALRELAEKWRGTADTWEREMKRTYGTTDSPRQRGVQPPERGRGGIKNWINWLRDALGADAPAAGDRR